MLAGGTPELRGHAPLVAHLVPPPVPLHHTVADDALRQILVRRADVDALDAGVADGSGGSRCEPVVGFQLLHGPDLDAHRRERLFQGVELGQQHRIDPVAGLVAGPHLVAE